jgi:hypothetical protein
MTTYDKYDVYNIYDSPIPYKNLLFHPVKMLSYLYFGAYSTCLTLDKNSVPDVNVISMNYWDYLCHASNQETPYFVWFREVLRICLQLPNLEMKIDNDGKHYFFELDIGDSYAEEFEDGSRLEKRKFVRFDGNDFDVIREIIVSQNCLELIDENIQKEVRDAMEEARKLRAKNGDQSAGIEVLMGCLVASSSLKYEDVYQLTIRKFHQLIDIANRKMNYQIYTTASMSGFVEFKDKSILKHWMSEFKKNKLDEVMEYDSIKNKVTFDGKSI